MFCDELVVILYMQALYMKKCFTLLREIVDSSFKNCTLPNNAGPLLVILVFNSLSSACVTLPFCFFVFVFPVVAESDSLSGFP